LRTPLQAIIAYAELLDMEIAGPLNETQRTQLGRIRVEDDGTGIPADKLPAIFEPYEQLGNADAEGAAPRPADGRGPDRDQLGPRWVELLPLAGELHHAAGAAARVNGGGAMSSSAGLGVIRRIAVGAGSV
jgi:hypothetical protein